MSKVKKHLKTIPSINLGPPIYYICAHTKRKKTSRKRGKIRVCTRELSMVVRTVVLAFWKLKQDDCKFETIESCQVRPYP